VQIFFFLSNVQISEEKAVFLNARKKKLAKNSKKVFGKVLIKHFG
jgi:hypothetical protein